MPTWTEKDSVFHDAGDVGGDAQAGLSHNRRWWHRNQDGEYAVLDVYTYPAYVELDEIAPDPKRLVVGVQIHFTLCRDLEDPGGTEEWSDLMHATVSDEDEYLGAADEAAQLLLKALEPGRLGWCGHAHQVDYLDVQAYCRVVSGAQFLDYRCGADWRSNVNVDILDVDHDYRCVLAQVDGNEHASFETMLSEMELTAEDCVRLGFYPSSAVRRPDDVDCLNNQWRRLISSGKGQ